MNPKALNIVMLSYHNQNGGAGIACGRLAIALKNLGHHVTYLVQEKSGNNSAISINTSWVKKGIAWLRFVLERLYFLPHEKDKSIRFLFNPGVFGQNLSQHPSIKSADIIHLHWMNFGFMGISDIQALLKLGKPVIWTLHDMWAFTGGCHHSGDCNRFQINCGQCKFVKQPEHWDISHQLWAKKAVEFDSANLKIITCSQWLKEKAAASSVLFAREIRHIPNAIDTQVFKPGNKEEARKKLGLDSHKTYLLFVAMRVNAPAKGFDYLSKALEIWAQNNPTRIAQTELLIVGGLTDTEIIHSLPLKVNAMGHISDPHKMIDNYHAADMFITPSLEENLPNTIMEAMACGTPSIGFNTGGIPEMIAHKQNGYVAQTRDSDDLAAGIHWILTNKEIAGKEGRKFVETHYSEEIIAQKHVEYYLKSMQDVSPN
jgi:glycosyltransferase involved in cell wall biosynthesis